MRVRLKFNRNESVSLFFLSHSLFLSLITTIYIHTYISHIYIYSSLPGTISEQWELCFALFDKNGDRRLNKKELTNMLLALYNSERVVAEAAMSSPVSEDHVKDIDNVTTKEKKKMKRHRPSFSSSIRILKREVATRLDKIVLRAFQEIRGDDEDKEDATINEKEWIDWAKSNITMLAFIEQVRQITYVESTRSDLLFFSLFYFFFFSSTKAKISSHMRNIMLFEYTRLSNHIILSHLFSQFFRSADT